jgi:hypothetical protein
MSKFAAKWERKGLWEGVAGGWTKCSASATGNQVNTEQKGTNATQLHRKYKQKHNLQWWWRCNVIGQIWYQIAVQTQGRDARGSKKRRVQRDKLVAVQLHVSKMVTEVDVPWQQLKLVVRGYERGNLLEC